MLMAFCVFYKFYKKSLFQVSATQVLSSGVDPLVAATQVQESWKQQWFFCRSLRFSGSVSRLLLSSLDLATKIPELPLFCRLCPPRIFQSSFRSLCFVSWLKGFHRSIRFPAKCSHVRCLFSLKRYQSYFVFGHAKK